MFISSLKRVKKYCKDNNIGYIKFTILIINSKISNMKEKLRNKLRFYIIDKKNRDRLKNKDATIISINCNGGTISHDLGMPFNSPFVNLWLYPDDFLKYCENMDYYNSLPLVFVKEEGIDYPIGKLDDIKIYFMHYLSEEDAREKWETRKKRINKDNLFFMMTDQEGCSSETMKRFDNLPYKNKVIFTHIPMNDIKSSFYIKGFEKESSVGILNKWTSSKSIKKHYDQFDYVKWLNGE